MAVNSYMLHFVMFKTPKLFLDGPRIYHKAIGRVSRHLDMLKGVYSPFLRGLRPKHVPWP